MNFRHNFTLALPTSVLEPGMAVPVETFLDWVEREEGKYEYDRGTIGMMVKVTQNHAVLGSRFVHALMSQLDPDRYQVLAEAFAVRVGRSVRFPDVLVQPTGQGGSSLESEHPVVIVEVVSPSSFHLDTVVKRDEYLALPTLAAYIVASQDNPAADVWLRGEDGRFPEAPVELEGFGVSIELPAIGATLSLADLYRHLKE